MSEESFGGTIRELITKLGFEVDDKELEGFERGLETAKVAAEALTVAWHGLVLGLFELTRETAEYGEEVQINSELLGISTDKFQKLRYAAQSFGIENESIITGLRFFNKTMGDAQHGMGEGGIALQRLKIAFRDLKDSPVDKQLSIIADRMHMVTNASERAAISQKLFGRAGAHFGQFVAQGSSAINSIGEQLNGLLMTPEQVEAGQKTRAALIQVKALMTALRNEIGVRLFPAVQMIAKSFLDWVQANKHLLESRIDKFVKILTDAVAIGWAWFKKFFEIVGYLIHALGGLENTLKLVAIALGSIFSLRIIGSILEGAKALRELGLAGLLTEAEILLPVAAIATLILALDDLRAWFKGEDSLLGTWIGPFAKIGKTISGGFKEIFGAFDGFGGSVWKTFKDGWITLKDFMLGDMKKFMTDLGKVAEDGKLFLHVFKGINKGLLDLFGIGQREDPADPNSLHARFQAASKSDDDRMSRFSSWDQGSWESRLPTWLQSNPSNSGNQDAPGTRVSTIHVNIEMPPGSPQSQADYVKQAASSTFDLMFNQHLFQAMQAAPAGE